MYRDDRATLLARIEELEAQLVMHAAKPFDWPARCPVCDAHKQAGTPSEQAGKIFAGWTYPKLCVAPWWVCLFAGCYQIQEMHLHQRCTACRARWVVTRSGVQFI